MSLFCCVSILQTDQISVVSEPALFAFAILASTKASKRPRGTRMDRHSELESFESNSEADGAGASRELRIYRPDGALSIIYFTAFGSDAKAISEAEKIARRGYEIDVWRGGTRISRVSDFNGIDKGEHQ
jgi:hypothetical protein